MPEETWTRRRSWPGEIDPGTGDLKDDWEILRNGKAVGRVYRRHGGMDRSKHYAWFLNQLHGSMPIVKDRKTR
jgi:hypothetical protein